MLYVRACVRACVRCSRPIPVCLRRAASFSFFCSQKVRFSFCIKETAFYYYYYYYYYNSTPPYIHTYIHTYVRTYILLGQANSVVFVLPSIFGCFYVVGEGKKKKRRSLLCYAYTYYVRTHVQGGQQIREPAAPQTYRQTDRQTDERFVAIERERAASL